MTDTTRIGDFIREHRKTHGLTRDNFEDKTGCSVATIERIEGGKMPGPETLQKLAAYFDTTVAEFRQWAGADDGVDADDSEYLPLLRIGDGRALADMAMRCDGNVHLDIPDVADADAVKALDDAYDGLHALAGADPGDRPSDRLALYQRAAHVISMLEERGLALAATDVRVHGHEVLDDGEGMPIALDQYRLTELVAVISDARTPTLKACVSHQLGAYEQIDDPRFRPAATTAGSGDDVDEMPF
jgi:transcriptional regulator with XRE-family HTH domain